MTNQCCIATFSGSSGGKNLVMSRVERRSLISQQINIWRFYWKTTDLSAMFVSSETTFSSERNGPCTQNVNKTARCYEGQSHFDALKLKAILMLWSSKQNPPPGPAENPLCVAYFCVISIHSHWILKDICFGAMRTTHIVMEMKIGEGGESWTKRKVHVSADFVKYRGIFVSCNRWHNQISRAKRDIRGVARII